MNGWQVLRGRGEDGRKGGDWCCVVYWIGEWYSLGNYRETYSYNACELMRKESFSDSEYVNKMRCAPFSPSYFVYIRFVKESYIAIKSM